MSFQQGLSGLNATSKNLEVIGNNIANANTFGAKASRAEFSDAYAMALNGAGSNRVGIGVNLATVSQQFTQGNIRTTENPMDLAINGGGFFQLSDGRSPASYSRNGQFKVDREGFVVNNAGLRLMGYRADTLGAIQPGQAVPMQLPTAGVAPQRTSELELEVNLDARQGATRPAAAPFIDYNDPDTYNSATSVAVYDVLGNPVALTYFFQKTADGVWDVYATANGTPVAGTALAPAPITTITYPADGTAPTAPAAPVAFDVPSTTTAAGAVTQAIAGVLFDVSGSTQFATPFGVTGLVQDGYSAGQLIALAVEGNGIVMARYSNGQSRPAGQVELPTSAIRKVCNR